MRRVSFGVNGLKSKATGFEESRSVLIGNPICQASHGRIWDAKLDARSDGVRVDGFAQTYVDQQPWSVRVHRRT